MRISEIDLKQFDRGHKVLYDIPKHPKGCWTLHEYLRCIGQVGRDGNACMIVNFLRENVSQVVQGYQRLFNIRPIEMDLQEI